ncbi:MAG: transcriptional regulator, LysR family [Tardiphaga sp.]|jgi:DNA-binding transcriptional LysR family regulator|nr:transcriptional regulator, LysR family [Tardiphaga sp.]
MRFDLVDLKLFVAVAEARSITRGAAAANLALASASARIKGLEDALGVALLTRGRRGVVLTAAGESLLGHARIVLHDVDRLQGDLASYARGLKASVHLLANTAGLAEHLPKALAAFLREHPHINVDVEERESADIAEAIAAGAADIGLAIDQSLPEGLARFPFCDDRLVLVVAQGDELANRRQVAFRDVVGRDFVGLANDSALQAHLATQAARLGARLTFRARLKDFDAVCQMVAAGIGVAVVPEAAAKRCARAMKIRTIRLHDRWAHRTLAICVRDPKALPRPAQQLLEHLRREADGRL